jgi:hypothetical protein
LSASSKFFISGDLGAFSTIFLITRRKTHSRTYGADSRKL